MVDTEGSFWPSGKNSALLVANKALIVRWLSWLSELENHAFFFKCKVLLVTELQKTPTPTVHIGEKQGTYLGSCASYNYGEQYFCPSCLILIKKYMELERIWRNVLFCSTEGFNLRLCWYKIYALIDVNKLWWIS